MLELEGLDVHYGQVHALRGLSLTVGANEIVALLGNNGAGKTTTLAAVSGLVRPSGGRIRFEDEDITRAAPWHLVGRGLIHVPEGRRMFGTLTVQENLQLGGHLLRDAAELRRRIDRVYGLLPRLAERRRQHAGTLSGGEQQMLAIGRAVMSNPKFLMLDEPSLGIAPRLISTIFEKIVEINKTRGITILLVEQNANLALEISSYAYVLETGHIVMQGESKQLRADPRLKATYLGG